ncbi:MAG: hypothetical protein AAFS10_23245, partial [Myxococcota bacterium]
MPYRVPFHHQALRPIWLLVVGVYLTSLTACPPDTDDDAQSFVCGGNTTLVDGVCVPTAICGPDTELRDGVCVAATVCGPNMVERSGVCVSTLPQIECGAGTAEQNGVCISTSRSVICGDGTVLQDTQCVPVWNTECGQGTYQQGDLCLPDVVCGPDTQPNTDGNCVPTFDVTCGQGTVVMEGRCLGVLEALTLLDAISDTVEDDPRYGGTPVDFELAPEASSVLLAGTLDPPMDLNGDGRQDQDVDWFRFTARRGQVIDITVLSDGLPGAAFLLEGDEPATAWFTRATALNQGEWPWRRMVVPVTGAYRIAVTSTFGLEETQLIDPTPLLGSPDYRYFVTVQTWNAIEPLALLPTYVPDMDLTAGLDDPTQHIWLLITPTEEAMALRLDVMRQAHRVRPALLVFDRELNFVKEIRDYGPTSSLLLDLPATGLIIVQDWISANGYPEQPDTLSLRAANPTMAPAFTNATLGQGPWSEV